MKMSFDLSSITRGLQDLDGKRESLARRMLEPCAAEFRDQARLNAPEGDEITSAYHDGKTGSIESGTLRRAIYQAFRDKQSTGTKFVYMVSWNHTNAFWGHMVEWGVSRKWQIVWDAKDQKFVTLGPGWAKGEPGRSPLPVKNGKRRIDGDYSLGRAFDETVPRRPPFLSVAGMTAAMERA